MALTETLPVGTDTAQWPLWSTTARLVVTDPAALRVARTLVRAQLAAVERACSRFRSDSELCALTGGAPVRVSPLLAELIGAALEAARRTDGDVDPTVGSALRRLGYDRDVSLLRAAADRPVLVSARQLPGWRSVRLDADVLTMPPGTELDLGATAKAFAAARCAEVVARRCGVGVMVALGGDIATAGPAPRGWRVLVADRPGEPACTIAVPAGAAVATSSTLHRRWRRGTEVLHHILDPRTCRPAPAVWRTASVVAFDCVEANTLTTAAMVRGEDAVAMLTAAGLPARLVRADGTVLTLSGWPAERAA